MLVQLLPEQAANHWEDIREAVEASLPPIVGMQSDRMSSILTAVLTGEIIVWVSVEGRNTITGIVLTTILEDGISGTKSLLIYCIYSYDNSSIESWEDAFETLGKYSKGLGCHRIIGYTDVKGILKFAERMGAETRFRLVSFDL